MLIIVFIIDTYKNPTQVAQVLKNFQIELSSLYFNILLGEVGLVMDFFFVQTILNQSDKGNFIVNIIF